MTHDIRLYVNSNLDQIQKWFETANGQKIQAKGSGTIALETLIDGKSSYVHLRNVHYCPELDSNLLSLGVLEKKGFKFVGKQGVLTIKEIRYYRLSVKALFTHYYSHVFSRLGHSLTRF